MITFVNSLADPKLSKPTIVFVNSLLELDAP